MMEMSVTDSYPSTGGRNTASLRTAVLILLLLGMVGSEIGAQERAWILETSKHPMTDVEETFLVTFSGNRDAALRLVCNPRTTLPDLEVETRTFKLGTVDPSENECRGRRGAVICGNNDASFPTRIRVGSDPPDEWREWSLTRPNRVVFRGAEPLVRRLFGEEALAVQLDVWSADEAFYNQDSEDRGITFVFRIGEIRESVEQLACWPD
jgi:hypothetical protein